MVSVGLFVLGLILVLKGADWLVDGASSIAKKLNISDLVIGLTVVAFGTSAPELAVNIFASVQGNPEIAIGNILGSNIANILLILGIAALIYPLVITPSTIRYEIPLSLLAAVMVGLLTYDRWLDQTGFLGLNRLHGFVLLGFFVIFMIYILISAKRGKLELPQEDTKQYELWPACGITVVGLVCLCVGGKLLVDGAVKLAMLCGVSQAIIGLTIVAVGTSLPELATSAVAAYKKNSDIAVGNIVGSNIFNIFFILGISAVMSPLPFQRASNVDIVTGIATTVLLWLFVFGKKLLTRWQGFVFLVLYAGYLVFRIMVDRGNIQSQWF